MSLIVIGVVHLSILAAVLSASVPPSRYIADVEEFSEFIESLKSDLEDMDSVSKTWEYVRAAAYVSLVEARTMIERPASTMVEAVSRIMAPWIASQKEIFWYLWKDSLENYAIYTLEGDDLCLRYRHCHSDINRSDRKWKRGQGHVGLCFAKNATIVSSDVTTPGLSDLLELTGPYDSVYYNSFVSTPITYGEKEIGVLVITSNVRGQFLPDLHGKIAELLAELLGISMQHCWKELNHERTKAV